MQNPDSFDRIVSYFHALADQDFEFNGTTFKRYDKLVLSDKIFRGYTCPPGCGACCMRCSLVWDVKPPNGLSKERKIYTISGVPVEFYVDSQEGTSDRFCQYLSSDGRCGIYENRPMPCRFELFKFVHGVARNTASAMVRLPGRGWNLTRVDGEKGAKCEIIAYDAALTLTHIRDLNLIMEWMDKFYIKHNCKQVIKYLETGPHTIPLTIDRNNRQKGIMHED